MDNIAASLLFGDGAAAAYITNEKGLYQIDDFYSEVAYQGYKDMAWNVYASGFQMTLSAYIPFVIGEQIEPMLMHALSNKNIRQNEIQHWAIHPGGKKILSEIEKVLSLASTDLDTSYAVLREYGNMSSVTIFYVLDAMRSKIKHADEQVFAAAFGPGLTIETMFLSSC